MRDDKDKVDDQDKIIERIKKRMKSTISADSDNRKSAAKDLSFANGDQWDINDRQRRQDLNRPCLVINVLGQYTRQISGAIKQNKPSIDVKCTSTDGNARFASVLSGIIRNIQCKSKFDLTIDFTSDSLVECGYGAWRVLTQYVNDKSFDQEPVIVPVKNPLSMYIDPKAKEIDNSDSNFGFILHKLTKDEFEEQYPDADYPAQEFQFADGIFDELFYEKDCVVLCEYFEKKKTKAIICKLSNGEVKEKNEAEEIERMRLGIKIESEREIDTVKIKRYICTADEILEENDFPGKYIPLIMVYGERRNICGKETIRGKIRDSRDPQSLYNYWQTNIAETISMAPRAQWIGTADQFKRYESDYAQSNVDNYPMLLYNVDPLAPGAPQRVSPPAIPAALINEANISIQMIEHAMGMYKASVGAPGNEISGVAINARASQSDMSNFVYINNISTAVEHTGRIILSILREIMDTERDVVVMGHDGAESFEPVNMPVNKVMENKGKYTGLTTQVIQQQQRFFNKTQIFNDFSQGEYSVAVTTGPSYKTQRQQSADMMLKFAGMSGRMNPIDKYYIAKNIDGIPPDYTDTLKKTLPPGLLPQRPDEPPPQPMPPDPKTQLTIEKEKTEQLKQQAIIAKATGNVQHKQGEIRAEVLKILKEVLPQ